MASDKSPGMLMRNAGIFNPVLVQAVGLCPVVAMATSVSNAALLAAVSAVVITFSELIASLFLKSVPRWLRIGIYIILGAAIVSPFMILIERINAPLFSSLGIYLPIMAVNSLNVLRCERFAVKISPLKALLDGITASVGYAAVLIIVGFFREFLGSGTLLGKEIFKANTLSGFLLPFGGFIILGFVSAALRSMIAKFWPKYLDKKQPKPGSKKKRRQEPEKKAASKPVQNIVPEFVADESPFTLEEFETITNEPTQIVEPAEESTLEPNPESKIQTESEKPVLVEAEQPEKEETTAQTEQPTAVEQPAEETTTEEDVSSADEKAPEESSNPVQEQPKPVFADLTIDDISDDNSQSATYSETDDDLDALMNRSIDDILTKPKKEEEEK